MFRHTVHRTIEWGQCDPAGIVFYPRYFEMFDAATAALFHAALGFNKAEMIARFGIVGIPMVDTRGRFHVPTSFGDAVRIDSTVTEFRRSSFDVHHELRRGDTLCLEGFETRVWVGRHPEDAARIKSRPIPAEVLERFGAAA
jgi:4-hydroxybenzoyl-CoA thioesterase